MSNGHSVSQWIASLKAGEAEAVQKLWDRYQARLVELARERLAKAPKRMADEEDVAQSAFFGFFRGATEGRFDNVRNRDELWWLLLAITRRKAVDQVRREAAQKRGGGKLYSEQRPDPGSNGNQRPLLDELIAEQPTPELLAMLKEQNDRLLALLRDDRLRQIAIARIEGYIVDEIAKDLGTSTRSVERKLQLVRTTWNKELFGRDCDD